MLNAKVKCNPDQQLYARGVRHNTELSINLNEVFYDKYNHQGEGDDDIDIDADLIETAHEQIDNRNGDCDGEHEGIINQNGSDNHQDLVHMGCIEETICNNINNED